MGIIIDAATICIGAFILGAALWAVALTGSPVAAAPVLGAPFIAVCVRAHIARKRAGKGGAWGLIFGSIAFTGVLAVVIAGRGF